MGENKIDRSRRLMTNFAELEQLSNICSDRINCYPKGEDNPPTSYILTVKVRSIIGINKDKMPLFAPSFYFKISFPEKYPNDAAPVIETVEGSDLPFHPYFSIKEESEGWWYKNIKRTAVWMDFNPYNNLEPLNNILHRMICSLQYFPEYVKGSNYYKFNEQERTYLSNWSAAEFYEEYRKDNGNKCFPTDSFDFKAPNQQNLVSPPFSDKSRFKIIGALEVKEKSLKNNEKKFVPIAITKIFQPIPEKVKPSFAIKDISKPFEPQEQSFIIFRANTEIDDKFTAQSERNANKNYHLYLTASSCAEIWKHITYGEHTHFNKVEQGGLMLGDIYKDSNENVIYAIVKKTIKAKETKSSRTHLEMNHEVWQNMMKEIDEEIKRGAGDDLRIIGWYHTHPNDLDVFMSQTDYETQKRFFKEDWQFAVVINPHRKIWKVFHGENCRECLGYSLSSIPLDIAPYEGEETRLLPPSE